MATTKQIQMKPELKEFNGKEPKKMTYKDIMELNALLAKCVNSKGFPPDAMLKMLDLKEELQKEVQKYQKVFFEIMNNHNVKEVNGSYEWKDHEQVEEISKQVVDLLMTETPIYTTNFLEGQFFIQMTEGLNFAQMSFMSNILRRR